MIHAYNMGRQVIPAQGLIFFYPNRINTEYTKHRNEFSIVVHDKPESSVPWIHAMKALQVNSEPFIHLVPYIHSHHNRRIKYPKSKTVYQPCALIL